MEREQLLDFLRGIAMDTIRADNAMKRPGKNFESDGA